MATKELFFEGKTIEAAVEKAALELNEDKDLLSYVVEETPTKGFLGIGATPAKIKVEIEVPDEPKKEAPKQEAPKKEAKIPAWEPEKLSGGKNKKNAEKPERKQEKKPAKKVEKAEKAEPAAPILPEVEKKPVDDENSKKITEFMMGLLAHIGAEEEAAVKVEIGEDDHYYVEVSGANMGVLIGRRGETLDAAQYLCGLVLNKGRSGDKLRVTLDTENYRAKRIRTLQNLAEKNAEKALKYKRNITMEPMSPYERRIIHAALTGREHITTFSVGSEPKRRVVVSYKK
ncbi:MAG: Jag N-terminal domain-containing protein [Clostridia bacterium]|nr:Jag N-terminal domain-containing protein [Clostridia bacterium]